MAAGDQGAAAPRDILSRRHEAHLYVTCYMLHVTSAQSSSFFKSCVNTCQGYSFTSVSTPPTILVLLLTRPQLQVPVGPEELGVVVIPDPSVVVVSDSSVVVAAAVVVVTTE